MLDRDKLVDIFRKAAEREFVRRYPNLASVGCGAAVSSVGCAEAGIDAVLAAIERDRAATPIVTVGKIKEVRQQTGEDLARIKKVLNEVGGDVQKAIERLGGSK